MSTSPTSELTRKHLAGLRALRRWCESHQAELLARGIDPRQIQRDYILTGALPAGYAREGGPDAGQPSLDIAKQLAKYRRIQKFGD